jgi:hypothetical protein
VRSAPACAVNGHTTSWEDIYHAANSDQQQQLLALARRQGLVYAHQLPATNGHKPPEASVTVAKLTRLLEGDGDLPPADPQPIQMLDEHLDRMQQEAVARALATPDICLIAGGPGTGKSRVVGELLTQAAARGERILFLARRPAAVDHVLEQLVERHVVLPSRCLEAGEKPELLSAKVRSATFAERVRKLREALPEAMRSKQRAEDRCRARRQEESVWPGLVEAGVCAHELAQQRDEIERLRTRVPEEIAGEAAAAGHAAGGLAVAGPVTPADWSAAFLAALNGERCRHAETFAELDSALAKVEQARAETAARLRQVEEQTNKLRPLVISREQGRFWSLSWWRALLNGNVKRRLGRSEQQREELLAAVTAAFEEINCLHQKRKQLDDEHQAAVQQLRDAEIRRRQEHWARRQAALTAEWHALEGRWRKLIERLESACRPATMNPQAVDQACSRWQECTREDEEACCFAGQWAAFLQESLETLPQRLPGLVNLVAATLAGLAADRHFGGTADFDLLVVEDAEQINEAEFLKIGQRARRWVLVGDPGLEKPAAGKPPARNGRVQGIPPRQKPAPSAPPSGPVSFFQRLWRSFRTELGKVPHAWVREGEQLCCRLKTIDIEQRKCLECERVADFPDIELRILTLPRAVPALAEVLFPPSMSLAQAKEYIYRELQELPLETTGSNACLVEDADRFVLYFGRLTDEPVVRAALEAGVCELLAAANGHPAGRRTCRLEFSKAGGWDRPRVCSWLFQHCRLRDSGRTAFLQRSYRSVPERSSPGIARIPNQIMAGS